MMRRLPIILLILSIAVELTLTSLALTQSARRPSASSSAQTGHWLTFGHDPQRSGWATAERTFTPQNVAQMKLVWQALLPNEPKVLTGLTTPLVVKNVQLGTGSKDLVIVAGSSDHVFALDAATGELIWQADFTTKERPHGPAGWLCPNALNATPVIDPAGNRVFAIASDGRLYTLSLRDGKELKPALRFVPPFAKMWSLNYVNGVLYTTLSQDCNDARSAIYAMNPDKVGHPITFFQSSQNCPGGFCGGGMWGRGGVAADFQGSLYTAVGDARFDPAANQYGTTVVKLEGGRLGLQDYYVPPNRDFIDKLDLDLSNTTPVIFRWRQRVLAAVGGKEGVIYLLDTASLGGRNHQPAAYVSPLYTNEIHSFQKHGIWGSLSHSRDPAGNVWLYVPTLGPPVAAQDKKFNYTYGEASHGSVMAFQVVADKAGRPVLKPVWRSRDLAVPDPVAIAGGVVFALSTGEDPTQATVDQISEIKFGPDGNVLDDQARLRRQGQRGQAVLYALEARTGRELWSSGQTMTDWTHFTGVAVGAGKVFVATNHGHVYAFGLTEWLGVKSYIGDQVGVAQSPPPVQPSAPAPSTAAPAAAIAELYQRSCAACHGREGRGDSSFRTPDFTKPEWQASRSDAAIREAILTGKEGGMPPFKGRLTDEQLTGLVQLIRRFASNK